MTLRNLLYIVVCCYVFSMPLCCVVVACCCTMVSMRNCISIMISNSLVVLYNKPETVCTLVPLEAKGLPQ